MAVILSKEMVLPVMGKPASDLAIGESVFLNVNGVPKEFLIVHQGNPDTSKYDASCDGTWLLMKDVYTIRQWHNTEKNSYKDSTIHTYLNGSFLSQFDTDIQAKIKNVKIPHLNGTGNSGATVAYGSSGLAAQVFLLSGQEVGKASTGWNYPIDGTCLSYFSGDSDTKRIAYYNGSAQGWWLRTANGHYSYSVYSASFQGVVSTRNETDQIGVRPALILPYDTLFDPNTNEFVGVG